MSLILATQAAASATRLTDIVANFYITCATVIPVLFFAVAVQGCRRRSRTSLFFGLGEGSNMPALLGWLLPQAQCRQSWPTPEALSKRWKNWVVLAATLVLGATVVADPVQAYIRRFLDITGSLGTRAIWMFCAHKNFAVCT